MSMQRAAVILYVKYDDVSDVVFLKKEKKALHDFDHSAAHKRIIRDSASGDVDKLVPELLDLVKCGKCFSVPCSSEAQAHTILCRLQRKHSERKAHHAIDGMEKAAHSELSFAAVSAVKRSFPPLPPSNIPVFEPPPGYVSVAGLQSKRSAQSQTLRPGAAVSPASGCTGNIYMPQPVQPGISTRRRLRQRPTV